MISALKQYSILDTTLTAIALIGAAIPSFILALLCLVLFGVTLRWLPISGLSTWKSWILPVGTSAFGGVTVFLRMSRTTMLEVIRQDYIRTARAKGQKESVVIRKHALKNCLIPLTTVLGGFLATLFSGSIIVETIFSVTGMGTYLLSGINARDYPVINGTVFIVSLLICAINLIVDIAYAFIDPRIRSQYMSKKKKQAAVAKLLVSEGGAS
jgi:peptide/nickel transport system permease protein